MMSNYTLGTPKRHAKFRHRPRLKLWEIHSYVEMVVPLAA